MLEKVRNLVTKHVVSKRDVETEITNALQNADAYISQIRPTIERQYSLVQTQTSAGRIERYFMLTEELKPDIQAIRQLKQSVLNVDFTQRRLGYDVLITARRSLGLLVSGTNSIQVAGKTKALEPERVYFVYVPAGTNVRLSASAHVEIYNMPFQPFAIVRKQLTAPEWFTTELIELLPTMTQVVSTIDEQYRVVKQRVNAFDPFIGNRTSEELNIVASMLVGGRQRAGTLSFAKYFYEFDPQALVYKMRTYTYDQRDGRLVVADDASDGAALLISRFAAYVLQQTTQTVLTFEHMQFVDLGLEIINGSQDVFLIEPSGQMITKDSRCFDATGTYQLRERISGQFVLVVATDTAVEQRYYQQPELFDVYVPAGTIRKQWLVTNITPEGLPRQQSIIKPINYAAQAQFFVATAGSLQIRQLPAGQLYFATPLEKTVAITLNNLQQQTFIITNLSESQNDVQELIGIAVYFTRAKTTQLQQTSGYNYTFAVIDTDTNTNVNHLYTLTHDVDHQLRRFMLTIQQNEKFYLNHALVITQMYADVVNDKPVFDIVAPRQSVYVQRITLKHNEVVEVAQNVQS